MTDIEKLRDDVINAAREAYKHGWDHIPRQDLEKRLDALGTAMRPDPWALLREFVDTPPHICIRRDWLEDARAAVSWREEHPDA